ncbi:hypothetical protein HZB78_05250 [Candidatus Collierbacteria bacterium]|nr:hypothetical protein [Candidatus Collierbacteria bacterium]
MSIPAVWPIVAPGFFPVHDDAQAARVQQMYVALRGGQFPVRWVPDLGYGYGYPIFNFYNPLPYYFGAGFMFIGFNVLTATKLMYVFPVFLSGITMFIFSRLVLSNAASALAGILYVYAPYHAVQIYVRGSVAEYWAYAILPLVFYALWKRKIIIGSLSLAALILSHNLTAFMSIPFVVLLFFISFRHCEERSDAAISKSKTELPYSLLIFVVTIALGIGLSVFFWLPATIEIGKTQVSQMVFEKFDPPSKHVAYPLQLWSGVWGYGGSSPGIDDGLSFQVGKIHLIGSLTAFLIYLGYILKKITNHSSLFSLSNLFNHFNHLIFFSIVGLVFSIFMLLPPSRPIWDAFPVLSYIQFPWRFLTFASLFSSLLTAWAIDAFAIRNSRPVIRYSLLTAYCLLLTAYSLPFFQPKFKFPITVDQLISREKLIWDYSKISDEYLPKGFAPPVNAEVALRIDNQQNKLLVDELKALTPVRQTANLISLFSVLTFITFIIVISIKKHGQNISG